MPTQFPLDKNLNTFSNTSDWSTFGRNLKGISFTGLDKPGAFSRISVGEITFSTTTFSSFTTKIAPGFNESMVKMVSLPSSLVSCSAVADTLPGMACIMSWGRSTGIKSSELASFPTYFLRREAAAATKPIFRLTVLRIKNGSMN
eukprot:Lithocolla_globosa_v1_NODE_1554_length_2490_cov_13.344559.p3 type:complete len:145 gc:universal NODE_1554_length_2490_cov_13.344559:1166-732(-)